MQVKKKLIVIVYLVVVTELFGAVQSLDSYKKTYEKNLEDIVLGHGMKMADLSNDYIRALDSLLAKVQKTGDFKKTSSVLEEIERFRNEKSMSEDISSSLDVQALQFSFRKKSLAYSTEKAKKLIILASRYDEALVRLQKSLVSDGNMDDAKAVQLERERIPKLEHNSWAKAFLSDAAMKPVIRRNDSRSNDEPAVVRPSIGFAIIGELKNKAKAWSNRDYVWMDVPSIMPVSRFTMRPGGSTDPLVFTVESPGIVFLASSDPEAHKTVLRGWEKTKHVFAYSAKNRTEMYVYEKNLKKGKVEIQPLGWAGPILLLP